MKSIDYVINEFPESATNANTYLGGFGPALSVQDRAYGVILLTGP